MHPISVELRLANLEERLRRARRMSLSVLLLLGAVLFSGQVKPGGASASQPSKDEIVVRRLVIVDEKGTTRLTLGGDPKEMVRRSPAMGLTIYDTKGDERGGFSTMDDGSVTFGMDAPAGVGSPMRDRLGLIVGAKGQASIMLIDNETRGVVQLLSDGSGKGGIQLYKWDLEKKKLHIKTLDFDGERTLITDLSQPK